jgi:nucleoside 2-deoxyribosyltransferase
MGICFVMQPFDNEVYDKRYEDVFAPAIIAAGLEPYRVDLDPGASILIEEIQSRIRKSDLCLAEITTDNPNVWFELGYAIASNKEVVMVCSADRKTRFPFDVQHRNITTYTTESSRDFDELEEKIAKRIKAILDKEETLGSVANMPPIEDVEGLAHHEMATLVTIGENIESPSDRIPAYAIKNDMDRAGFTRIAVTLALTSLLNKGMIEVEVDADINGNEFYVYTVSQKGMHWLLQNQDRLILKSREPNPPGEPDEIPF